MSSHCIAQQEETRGLIGWAELKQMKRGSFLINTARGPVVREADLLAAYGRAIWAASRLMVEKACLRCRTASV